MEDELFGAGFRRLVARIERRFRGGVSAEDAVQEALIRAWQQSAAGEEIASLDAWVATVAGNVARSELRRRQAEAQALARCSGSWPAGTGSTGEWPPELQHLGPVAAAIEELPERQGQVIILHYYGDLRLSEIATILGITEGTVKSSLHRARSALRSRLQAERRPARTRRTTMATGWFMAGSHPHQYRSEVAADAYHGGRAARLMFSSQDPPAGFGTLMQTIRSDRYLNRRVRLSAMVRTQDVDGWLGLWMRVDGQSAGRSLAFDNMQPRAIKGTTDWHRYDVVLDVAPEATAIAFGVLLSGRGEGWIADMRFEEVGLDVPTTGRGDWPDQPQNLDFSEGLPPS
ncbi:MAG TPA: RNA polymerase sigma factor [Candidatus Dormibacteraeota bacterium]|nr:RNA polymerase sigma factor [Candidatus Dormibacteraeota bacterium]